MSRSALILPVRSLRGGKSRLVSVLTVDQRAVLIGAMAQRALYLGLDSGMADHLYLVTRDPMLGAVLDATDPRVQVLMQPGESPGLNEAIDLGRLAAIGVGAERLMVLLGDVPLVTVEDIQALGSAKSLVAMVPDGPKVGTNALMLNGSEAISRFPMRFGVNSHRLHWEAATRLGLTCTDVDAPGIAFDLDTPEDWAQVPEAYREVVLGAGGSDGSLRTSIPVGAERA